MTTLGTVLFLMYTALIGVGLAIWTFRDKEEDAESEVNEALDELSKKLRRRRADIPKINVGKGNVIELDPNNPLHRGWYEDR